MLSKRSRQQLIRSVVSQQRISTQLELVNTLRALGCEVTQATISRDIRELGLDKSRDKMGRARYTLPETEQRRDAGHRGRGHHGDGTCEHGAHSLNRAAIVPPSSYAASRSASTCDFQSSSMMIFFSPLASSVMSSPFVHLWLREMISFSHKGTKKRRRDERKGEAKRG